MKPSKSKWLAYTVLVALIPILCRVLLWVIAKADTVAPFAASDVVAFGLVMHISSINELEHVTSPKDRPWKTIQNGISVLFIALYSVLFGAMLLAERNPALIDSSALLKCVAALAGTSLILGFSVLHRLNASRPEPL